MILRGVFGLKRPEARMSAAEVVAILMPAARAAGVTDEVDILDRRLVDGRVVWLAGTTTRDAGWSITVDDATGDIIGDEHWTGWQAKR